MGHHEEPRHCHKPSSDLGSAALLGLYPSAPTTWSPSISSLEKAFPDGDAKPSQAGILVG